MNKLLSRTTAVSATLIAATLSTPVISAVNHSAETNNADLQTLISAAQKEGAVYSVGMPDSWANWKGTCRSQIKLRLKTSRY
ncbi:putative periplasmic solute-binding protein [Vibrio ponticus]|nr:putative periplasmic solute-binding protein [Vibrio ponticus]